MAELDRDTLKTLHNTYYQNYIHFSDAFGKMYALYIIVITTFLGYILSREQLLAKPLLLFSMVIVVMSTVVLERWTAALRRWVDALEKISEWLDPVIFERLALEGHFKAWKRFLILTKFTVLLINFAVIATLFWAMYLGGASPGG